ncbi:hypothetical protein CGCS363_v003234 [Colletotrichum siamense]|uniref:uncharacterized protein n=1 Tax=Colletotrichum siamense TaxID=690259 RepID=UPI0018732154|nr:uncharacterized protein CGCS363_v003234 [Colletotrichum siamense]KAF5510559.1 hypothetical protein CGCS363_v003234 [Colletotrichum siamense]
MKSSLYSPALAATVSVASAAQVDWTVGMRMHAFMTKATQCPETYADAAANSTYLPVFSTDKTVVAGAEQPSNAGRTFYFTNGFHTTAGERWDSATRTGIQNAEPVAAGGGCWSISDDQGATVTTTPCTYADNQTFWVEAWRAPAASGPFQIVKQGLDRLAVPANAGDAIGWAESDDVSAFCFYEADSGSVVRSSEARAADRASTIAGAEMPTGPVDLIELPGCMADDVTYAPRSMDCLVAKTANTVPSNCSATPQSRECVLHLFPAFCGDLPKTAGPNATQFVGDDAIEGCLRRVSQGPCVANPAGAACLSGLFPGIVFATGPPPSQSASQRLRRSYPRTSLHRRHELLLHGRQNARDPLFGDPNESWLPAEDQFWVGFAKSIINSAVDFVTHFDDDLREFQVTLCHGMVAIVDALKGDLAPRVKKGCDTLWRLHTGEAVPSLKYQGDLEKAGGVTAEVVQILAPVADAVEAAKALGAGKYLPDLLGKFAPKAVEGGQVLEAASADGGKAVRIYKKGPKGDPEVFKTTKDEKVALEDIENNGFLNCEKIARGARKKRQGSLLGDLSDLDLSCDFSTFADNVDEGRANYDSDSGSDSESDSDWEYEPPAAIPAHVKAEGLTAEESTLLADLKSKWDGSRTGERYMPEFADPDLQSFRTRIEATTDVAERKKVVRDFAAKYKLTRSEIGAFKAWADLYEIHDNALKSAAAKIPPFKGLVRRTTALDDATMTMLTDFESGIISKGDKGVYEIRDLVSNVQSLGLGSSGEPPRKFLASSAGLTEKTWFGGDKMFVIQSESGMYISPGVFDADELYEVDFLDGVSGRMKLLGYDGTTENGVTTPTVFYFQNLPPASQS